VETLQAQAMTGMLLVTPKGAMHSSWLVSIPDKLPTAEYVSLNGNVF
jgi:hypothetical protein